MNASLRCVVCILYMCAVRSTLWEWLLSLSFEGVDELGTCEVINPPENFA